MGSRGYRVLAGLAGAFPVAIMFKDCCLDLVMCQGISMQPTINPYPDKDTLSKYYFSRFAFRDVVLLDKMSVMLGQYEKGSVVLFKSIEDPNRLIMKRLVATEGDWVINKVRDSFFIFIFFFTYHFD